MKLISLQLKHRLKPSNLYTMALGQQKYCPWLQCHQDFRLCLCIYKPNNKFSLSGKLIRPHQQTSSPFKPDTELCWFTTRVWIHQFQTQTCGWEISEESTLPTSFYSKRLHIRKLGSWQPWEQAQPFIQVVWIIPWLVPWLCRKHRHRGSMAPPPHPPDSHRGRRASCGSSGFAERLRFSSEDSFLTLTP